MTGETAAADDLSTMLSRIADGDRSALQALYQNTSAKLFGVTLSVLRTREDAEEVLQTVYLSVWRNAASFERNKGSAIGWLCTIARNRSIDRLRRRELSQAPVDAAANIPDAGPSPFTHAADEEEAGRLQECLHELDGKASESVRNAFFQGMTYARLAEDENVPLGTMKSRIRRALAKLRECLDR